MGVQMRIRTELAPNKLEACRQVTGVSLQVKLEGLFNTGLVQRHDLDAKCFIELRYVCCAGVRVNCQEPRINALVHPGTGSEHQPVRMIGGICASCVTVPPAGV